MLNNKLICMVFFMGFSCTTFATSIEHYNIDFNAPTNVAGQKPTVGNSSDKISRVVFGDPIVQDGFGSFSDQSLVFNTNVNTYEQIKLDLGRGHDNYKISFDIETQNLVGSDYSFNMIADTPTVQTMSFHGTGNIKTYNPYTSFSGGKIGGFNDDDFMHVDIYIDLIENTWTIDTGVWPSFVTDFYASENDIKSLRFNLSPWRGGSDLDPSISIGLDNIIVTSEVPEPTSPLMISIGLIGLAFFIRKRKVSIASDIY